MTGLLVQLGGFAANRVAAGESYDLRPPRVLALRRIGRKSGPMRGICTQVKSPLRVDK
jgi:hypothetical protein